MYITYKLKCRFANHKSIYPPPLFLSRNQSVLVYLGRHFDLVNPKSLEKLLLSIEDDLFDGANPIRKDSLNKSKDVRYILSNQYVGEYVQSK